MNRITGQAGGTIAAYELCYLKQSDGKYYPAKADVVGTMPGIVIAQAALAADEIGTFVRDGLITNSSWSWTVNGLVYASGATAGAMTQTAPATSGHQLQIVGIAKAATVLDFQPQLIAIEIA